MRSRLMTWGPVAGTFAAGALLTGAEPVTPRPFPPLPVPPVERQSMPPYFARMTISGESKMNGVFEVCMDPAAASKAAVARAEARPPDAPRFLTGCTSAHAIRPDGSMHMEMTCDRAKGAKASFRMISDGTTNDLRTRSELYDSAAGAPKTIVIDRHIVRLGPCPADLKPGQMRRPGGPALGPGEASRLFDNAAGTRR
ncbi:MAG: hypothetical protein ACJ798_19070 [Phenylobacterium sp.]